jgi:transposase
MSIQHVRKWCREFKDGRTDVIDQQRSGRPSVSDETIAKVEETMLKDRRVKVRELCEMIPDVSSIAPSFLSRK